MSKGTSSDLNSEQDLASIPTAQWGLSRLAIARLKSAGVPVVPLLRRVGLTHEVIADPEERLIVRSQIKLLDEAAIALQDDCLGFTLARDFDPRALGLLYYVMASSQTLSDALKRVARYSQTTNEALVVRYREGNRLIINLSYSGVPRHSDRHQIEFCMFAVITNLPRADRAEPRPATLLDCPSSVGKHRRNGAICRNGGGVRGYHGRVRPQRQRTRTAPRWPGGHRRRWLSTELRERDDWSVTDDLKLSPRRVAQSTVPGGTHGTPQRRTRKAPKARNSCGSARCRSSFVCAQFAEPSKPCLHQPEAPLMACQQFVTRRHAQRVRLRSKVSPFGRAPSQLCCLS